ncbi:MAG: 1-phosphofructokinase, partial [Clostridia bacterium]|nr:1-phosphofructokinase [Clostridia bacterium]
MITTVTLNPAIDRTVVVEKFAFGEVNRVQSVREDMGGKGINVARILQSLGSQAKATGFIGHSNIGHVRSLLEHDGLDTDLIEIDAATRTNTKLIETASRSTTDINEAGFAVDAAAITAIEAKIDELSAQSQFIVFSGSLPKGLPADFYRQLISRVRPPCQSVLDADGILLLEGLKASPTLIKPNIHELESALGTQLDTEAAIVAACRQLIAQYDIVYVLVSMGGDGSILVSKDQAIFAEPLKVEVRGTVGAGDSMLAGFVHCLAQNLSMEQALSWATACGALAVSKVGTESFSRQDVERMAAQV